MWAVVTVPERRTLADALLPALGEPATLVLDREGDVQRNHVRAWREAARFDRPWVGVIQDDAVLCDDFAAKVRRRLEEAETRGYRAISLYSSHHNDRYLEPVDERWSRVDLRRMPGIRRPESGEHRLRTSLPSELCVLARREVAAAYDDFAHRNARLYRLFPGVHDAIVGLFLNAHLSGRESASLEELLAIETNLVYIARPNLVDHRDVPSTLGGHHPSHLRRRYSSTFRADAD